MASSKIFFPFAIRNRRRWSCSHLVQLGAGRSDLLDAKLSELALELSELLRQIILVLAPERTSLDLARRLQQPVSDPFVSNIPVCMRV